MSIVGDVGESMPTRPASAQEGRALSGRSELTAHGKRPLNVVVVW